MGESQEQLHIVLLSIHGLIRGHDLELGRDADTGGQTKYVVDLARDRGEQLLRAATGPQGGAVNRDAVRTHGPHLLSGGWWARESRRMYHFVEAEGGRILWVFHEDGRWYLQGEVE